MLAFAELRVELEVAQVLVVSQPPLVASQGKIFYRLGDQLHT